MNLFLCASSTRMKSLNIFLATAKPVISKELLFISDESAFCLQEDSLKFEDTTRRLSPLCKGGREGFIRGIENDTFSSNQPPLVPPLCYCLRLCMQLDAIFIGTAKRRCRDCILFLNNNGRRRHGNSWLMQLDVESRSVTATLQGSNAAMADFS